MRNALFLLLAMACQGPASAPPVPEPAPAAPTPAPVAAAAPAPAAPAPEGKRMGKVLEVLDSGEYTIARMDACGQDAWVAGPKTALQVGQTVSMPMGTAMQHFEAKSLGRTFDLILFVDSFEPTTDPIQCAPPPPPPPPPTARAAVPTVIGVVKETMDSGGYTYARVDQCGKERWVAAPQTPLKVGDAVQIVGGVTMDGFQSPTLGRTFEHLDLVDRIRPSPTPPTCP